MKPLLIALIACILFYQSKAGDSIKYAPVQVTILNAKQQPRKNEQIVFYPHHSVKTFSGRSNADGFLTVRLPAGDDYTVAVKTLGDTTEFGTISIAALKENQQYTSAFKLNIEYEPARLFTLDNVEFDVGKATLRPSSYKELNELADYLKWQEEQQIEIAGHTDNVGKEADNMKLSQQRADAVKNYLLKKGIKPARVVAKGYGASEPVADNTTSEGRQKNRRTEVRLL